MSEDNEYHDEPLYDYENQAVSNEQMEELEKEGFVNDLEVIMSTFNGRRFIYRLIHEICQADGACFTGNSWTNFNLGKREVGRLVDVLAHNKAFDKYIIMLKEANNGFIDPNEREKIA